MHVLVPSLDGATSLQRSIHDLLEKEFGIFFATVQLETECLETGAAAKIDYGSTAPTVRREPT